MAWFSEPLGTRVIEARREWNRASDLYLGSAQDFQFQIVAQIKANVLPFETRRQYVILYGEMPLRRTKKIFEGN